MCMKAWLYAQDRARQNTFQFQIVFDRNQAIEMAENNAHEVMRGAEGQYPEYQWELVKVSDIGLFIVEGTRK